MSCSPLRRTWAPPDRSPPCGNGPERRDRVSSWGNSPLLRQVPLERIEADTSQPREDFPRPDLEALADSIDALGLVHPLVVEQLGTDRYRLIAGERRLRALRIGRETGR